MAAQTQTHIAASVLTKHLIECQWAIFAVNKADSAVKQNGNEVD